MIDSRNNNMRIRNYIFIAFIAAFLSSCHTEDIPVPEKNSDNTEQTDDPEDDPEQDPEDKPVNEELLLGLDATLNNMVESRRGVINAWQAGNEIGLYTQDRNLKYTYEGLLAHFTQIYHLYNLLIYNILRRNLQLFITEFCIFSPCIIFISNKNSDKSIEILHISPKYITSVDNLMIHIFSSTFNFLYSFTPSDRLESKS